MRFEVTILGSNSAKPANGRHPTAHVLNIQEQLVLIDCGEGTQNQMNAFGVKRGKINHIFISHLHGDHIFGLPGLLTSFSLDNRKEPLTIFSPKGLQEIIEVIISNSGSHLSYDLHFVETDPNTFSVIFENDVFEVVTIPLIHRVPTNGYLFREKPRPRTILSAKIEAYQIPYEKIKSIKNGADFMTSEGKIIENKELTIEAPKPRSYAFCSDTIYHEAIIPMIKNVDLLYHEATYLHDKLERARFSKHTTALQAARIAKKSNAQQLIIGHYSSRYKDVTPLLEEAQSIFENTLLAEEGKVYSVQINATVL